MTAEQSNTSLVYGDTIVLKVYRRPHPGLHPDVEVHAALAAVGCAHVAAAYGWIESPAGTLAFAQEFLAGGVEGWDLAKSSVRDLLREGDLHADEVGGDFADEARRLGEVTAEVHLALQAALPTASWGQVELAARAELLHENLAVALEAAPALEPYARALARDLRRRRDALDRRPRAARARRPAPRPDDACRLRLEAARLRGRALATGVRAACPRQPAARRGRDAAVLRVRRPPARRRLRAGRRGPDHVPGGRVDRPQPHRVLRGLRRCRPGATRGTTRCCCARSRPTRPSTRCVYESRMRPSWVPIPLAAIERLAG